MSESSKKSQADRLKVPGSEPLQRVLIAIDLTSVSDRVLSRVALLPLSRTAHVTLFHVVPDNLPHMAQERAVRDARKALREEVAYLRNKLLRGAHIEGNVKVGNGAKDIANMAKTLDAELVVMGRGGGRALRDTFLGSTAERVIRLGRVPVLTVRLPGRAAYRKPALALEFDESAVAVIGWTRRILAPTPPHITVIHAVDTPYQGIVYPSVSRADSGWPDGELEQEATRKIAKQLDQAKCSALRWKPHVRAGSARLVIGKAVKRAESDLLVLGTRGHTGLAYVVLGTVAGDVLREVSCDVLVVPPRASKARKRARVAAKS